MANATHAALIATGKSRQVRSTIFAQETTEGDGASVRRSIGSQSLRRLDPFLMLDHGNSRHETTLERGGSFPDHPHRGQMTVTYMLNGKNQHEDCAGHAGVLERGDVQWMTAGRGIVHSETPIYEEDGEAPEALQLWIDIPAKDKLIEPSYQDIRSVDIPVVNLDNGVSIKVISGESHGVKAQVNSLTPVWYFDIHLPPSGRLFQPIPRGWTAFTYIVNGSPTFGTPAATSTIDRYHAVVFSADDEADGIEISNAGPFVAKIILIAGQPLKQPVVQYGPFVMTTQAEIMQAFEDYREHKNGFENAAWVSQFGTKVH